MTIHLWPPCFLEYSENIPEGFAGKVQRFTVYIRPEYKDDEGLFQHELQHVRQTWCGLGIFHWLLYPNVRRYRAWAEASAFKKQMQYPSWRPQPMSLDEAAEALTLPKYDLGLTVEQAKELL